MGLLSKASGFLTGKAASGAFDGGSNAALEAARLQGQGVSEGIAESRDALNQARGDLSPFRQAGAESLSGLSSLLTDKSAQADFLKNNPFYSPLADKAQQDIFNRQAARGKSGSGETANIVQNKLLQIGTELINKNINQRFNLSTLGANAASGQATGTTTTANSISDLLTQGGNAQAAGIVGAQNAQTANRQQAAGIAAAIFASDRRIKTDINQVTEYKGLPVYTFKYIGSDVEEVGFMAQDVQKVLPHAVIEIDGVLHVKYGEIINGY